MKSTPKIVQCTPDVRLDAAAEVTMESNEYIRLDAPRNMLVSWERQRQYSPVSPSVLSVRWSENGQRFFDVGKRRYAVDDTGYMVFNNGTEFGSEIDSETVVRCYTVNFVPGMAEEILRGLITPDDRLLDDPNATDLPKVAFLEKTYRHDPHVSPILRRLEQYQNRPPTDYAWFEEQFRFLVEGLLQAHRNIFREMEQIPAMRAATREELYTRLHTARDFMEAGLDQPLTVPEIARHACLSTHHFLRMFKHLFQETPHQYLIRRRMERARQMLLHSDAGVTQICFALGFESLGSFSWLFRTRTGVSPEQFRMQARRGAIVAAPDRSLRPQSRPVESGGSLRLDLSLAPQETRPDEGC